MKKIPTAVATSIPKNTPVPIEWRLAAPAPLDVSTDVAWIGFANSEIREQVWSVLPEVLAAHGLSPRRGGKRVGH